MEKIFTMVEVSEER